MDLSKLYEWIKLSPKYLFAIALITGFALFAPTDILIFFGIEILVIQIRSYIGIVFLISVALLLTHLISSVFSTIQMKIQGEKTMHIWQKSLHSLTDEEKTILKYFIDNGTQSRYLPTMNGVVNGLEHKDVIYKSSNIGNSLDRWPYNIQPWAWEYLNEHRELLILNNPEIQHSISNPYRRSPR